jgi:hypothetical protein
VQLLFAVSFVDWNLKGGLGEILIRGGESVASGPAAAEYAVANAIPE